MFIIIVCVTKCEGMCVCVCVRVSVCASVSVVCRSCVCVCVAAQKNKLTVATMEEEQANRSTKEQANCSEPWNKSKLTAAHYFL